MEQSSPRVSAIVPAFNEAERLQAVLAVLRTCRSVDEVIVVDDGSTDSTASVVAAFPDVKYYQLPVNQGKGAALDEGARRARGSIFCFVDADVTGLTCAHICALVRPVQAGRAAMAIGRRETVPYKIFRQFLPNLSGERALLRTVWEGLPEEYRRGYMVETGLNAHCRRWKFPVIHLLMHGVRNVNKRKKWGALRGNAMQLASTRDILGVYISLWGFGRKDGPNLLSLFGFFFKSVTDKVLLVVVLIVLGVTDATPAWVSMSVAVLILAQISIALLYVVQRVEHPKTFLGPFIFVSLLTTAIPLPSTMRMVVSSTTVLFALNDLYYYTGPLWHARVRTIVHDVSLRLAATSSIFMKHGTSLIDNYRLKLRRPLGSNRIATVPNLITLGRLAMVPSLVVLVGERQFGDAIMLGAIFIALDMIDGYLARASGQCTRLGKILDVLADKAAIIGVLLALFWIGALPIWLIALVVARVAIVAAVASFLFFRAMPLPWSFWPLPADAILALYVWWPSQESLWLAVVLNLQSVISYAYQASSIVRQHS